ncbi:MAG: hypothetical protein GYA24_04320 [Candidatus Lokiarchaeota archaeon]|nr:hypothetical protein [Candidatus Lokiarchaeota archaeon]
MLKITLPEILASECNKCKKGKITQFAAPELSIMGKDEVVVPFRIHLPRYKLDSTKFKLIDYKSTKVSGKCNSCGQTTDANLLFDDDGRSFGLFTARIEDRYLFQHSSGIADKAKYMADLKKLDFCD